MASEKLAASDRLARGIDDLALGAAGIGHEGAGLEQRIDVADRVEDAADGLGEKDQVGIANGIG